MSWLLIVVVATWAVSLASVMWLDRVAGDDPLGTQDPDAPAGPAMWLVPPPLELPVPRGPTPS